MKVSILITTFKRSHLLNWGLYSLARQKNSHDTEIIVLNDGIQDETEGVCNKYKDKLNIRYIFTGKRNTPENTIWRIPGFAFNIGAKLALGDILFLSCAEMFHMGNSVQIMTDHLINFPNTRVIPMGVDDVEGGFLKAVNDSNGNPTMEDVRKYCGYLNTHLPFFMGLMKSVYINMGGYDEDFIGMAYDDDDIVSRLNFAGIRQCQVPTSIIHLWHQRFGAGGELAPKWAFNKNLYAIRYGLINRNVGKNWGHLT